MDQRQLTKLTCDNAVLLVVDIQERLLPAIHEGDAVVAGARKLLQAADVLKVPVLVTEQYPAGLGPTCAAVRDELRGAPVIEKVLFSACVAPVMQRLGELKRRSVIVCGIEAHVCVQQTVLDLLRSEYVAHLCADAVSSRRPMDRDTAIARMRQAGAIVTTVESAIFELMGQAGTEQFKRMLKVVK